jgi:hypothetical protein
MRMFDAGSDLRAKNLFAVIGALQKNTGVELRVVNQAGL